MRAATSASDSGLEADARRLAAGCVGGRPGCGGGDAASTVPIPPVRPSIRSSFIARQFAYKRPGWRLYRIEHVSCANCNHTVTQAHPYDAVRRLRRCVMHRATLLMPGHRAREGHPVGDSPLGDGLGYAAAWPCGGFFCRAEQSAGRMSALSRHQRSLSERYWRPCVYLL